MHEALLRLDAQFIVHFDDVDPAVPVRENDGGHQPRAGLPLARLTRRFRVASGQGERDDHCGNTHPPQPTPRRRPLAWRVDLMTLCRISGHVDPSMILKRYYRERVEDIAARI